MSSKRQQLPPVCKVCKTSLSRSIKIHHSVPPGSQKEMALCLGKYPWLHSQDLIEDNLQEVHSTTNINILPQTLQ